MPLFESCRPLHVTWSIGVLTATAFIWYGILAGQWYASLQHAAHQENVLWKDLIFFFLVGSLAWAVPLSLLASAESLNEPGILYFLGLLNAICPVAWFTIRKRLRHFHAYGDVGAEFASLNLANLSDQQVASATRALSAEYIARVAAMGREDEMFGRRTTDNIIKAGQTLFGFRRSLQGPVGPRGPRGPMGPEGPQGPQGIPGDVKKPSEEEIEGK